MCSPFSKSERVATFTNRTQEGRIRMDHRIIVTPGGERLVLVPESDYAQLIEAREMADDVAAFDAAKRKLADGTEELLPAAFAKRILKGENPIRVWRDYRGMTATALAAKAGLAQAYVSQVETGTRDGTVGTLKKIAAALGVTLDDIAG
jgi:DNA-binding XRE family transcriptional regulator